MPTTAFSNHFRRELDVGQLARLILQDAPDASEDHLSDAQRVWIRTDVRCSSCGVGGAQIVRATKPVGARGGTRQAHFRFVGDDAMDAHHRFCEFHGADGQERQSESLVDFGSAKTIETRLIRQLVCKGIEQGIFDQTAIRGMRQWFFDLKAANRFTIGIDPTAVDWLSALLRHPSYQRWVFHPVQAQLPGFDWKQATRQAFTEQFWPVFDHLSGRRLGDTKARTKDLVARYAGQELFDPAALKPSYELTLQFATFIGRNSGLDFRRSKPDEYRWKGAPPALLALCALILFVSDWQLNAAIGKFARIVAAPDPSDPLLGNVVGLNPFPDYAAWQMVMLAQEIAEKPTGVRLYDAELARIEAELREVYRVWTEGQG